VCEWNYLINGQLVFLLEHVSAGNIRSVELHCCMHVFLFHLSWRQQFWNILGIPFVLFYFGLKFWKGLKSDESMQRQASQSSPFCQVITSDEK
jgi:hypothetical protein